MLRFFQHLDRFDPSRPIEPWLYQIVRNRVRDLMRRESLRRHESLDAWLERGLPETVDRSADPAADAERSDLQRLIWQADSQLTEAHRKIFVLRDYHDLSYREILLVVNTVVATLDEKVEDLERKANTWGQVSSAINAPLLSAPRRPALPPGSATAGDDPPADPAEINWFLK